MNNERLTVGVDADTGNGSSQKGGWRRKGVWCRRGG